MESWEEVLDFWEHKIYTAEQALESHIDWDNVDIQPFVLPDGLGMPSKSLLPRYEGLAQRTQAVEQRVAIEGARVLSELENIVSFRAHRYETPSEPSRVDAHA